jgi:hypothetical protein
MSGAAILSLASGVGIFKKPKTRSLITFCGGVGNGRQFFNPLHNKNRVIFILL